MNRMYPDETRLAKELRRDGACQGWSCKERRYNDACMVGCGPTRRKKTRRMMTRKRTMKRKSKRINGMPMERKRKRKRKKK